MSSSHVARRPRPRPGSGHVSAGQLPELTAGWVADGLISAEQRDRILARDEQDADTSAARPASGSSVTVEALGYVGGAVVVVAGLMLGFRIWDRLGTVAHVSLVGGVVVVLLGAGVAAAPPSSGAVGERIRSVLWLAATAATTGLLFLLGADVLELGDGVSSFAATGTMLVAAGLWSVHRTAVQQAAFMVATMGAVAASLDLVSAREYLPGLGVWCVGVVWATLCWGGVLAYRRVGLALGSAAAILGATTTVPDDAGTALALVTAVAVVALAVWFRDLVLLAVGALGSLNVLPAVVSTWWPDTLAAPLTLLTLGLVLLVSAVYVARRQNRARGSRPDRSRGTVRTAWMLACPLLALLATVLVVSALA